MAVYDKTHPRQQLQLALDEPCLRLKVPQGEKLRRLKRSALAILGRLQRGEASGLELWQAGGGMRYPARVWELRQAGHDIRLLSEDDASGRTVYGLFVDGQQVGG